MHSGLFLSKAGTTRCIEYHFRLTGSIADLVFKQGVTYFSSCECVCFFVLFCLLGVPGHGFCLITDHAPFCCWTRYLFLFFLLLLVAPTIIVAAPFCLWFTSPEQRLTQPWRQHVEPTVQPNAASAEYAAADAAEHSAANAARPNASPARSATVQHANAGPPKFATPTSLLPTFATAERPQKEQPTAVALRWSARGPTTH